MRYNYVLSQAPLQNLHPNGGTLEPLASKPIMILGNFASIILAIAGILQVVSWTIAGATILAILSIATLAPTRFRAPGRETGKYGKKAGGSSIDTKPIREKTEEKSATRPHQTPSRPEQRLAVKDEQRHPPKSDFQKSTAPKITPPKTVPTSFSPTKAGLARPGMQKQEAIRPIPVGPGAATPTIVKPAPVKIDPNSRTIAKGDYATYDVELNQRAEVTCEVTANSPVNVYLMDEDNVNSLDLGEEFWSETGEECVQNATLHFVAPQSGKWVLVVENIDNKEVSATAIIRKGQAKTATGS